MATKTRPFNTLMSQEDYDHLQELADGKFCSKGAIVRTLIRSQYAMQVSGQPTCANGNPCFVPQMHQRLSGPGGPPG